MNRTISTKQFGLWLLATLILGFLSGCNPGKSDNSDRLEFWTMQLKPNFTSYFADLNANFETKNEAVELRWVDVPWSAMENKILTSISA